MYDCCYYWIYRILPLRCLYYIFFFSAAVYLFQQQINALRSSHLHFSLLLIQISVKFLFVCICFVAFNFIYSIWIHEMNNNTILILVSPYPKNLWKVHMLQSLAFELHKHKNISQIFDKIKMKLHYKSQIHWKTSIEPKWIDVPLHKWLILRISIVRKHWQYRAPSKAPFP